MAGLAAPSWPPASSCLTPGYGRAGSGAVARSGSLPRVQDRRLLGAPEHLGGDYTGVSSRPKLADAKGFRRDVLAEVKTCPFRSALPGRNSLRYNCLDGVAEGQAPTVLDRPGPPRDEQCGTNEFIECASGGPSPAGRNPRTGTPKQAVAYFGVLQRDKGTSGASCAVTRLRGPQTFGTGASQRDGRPLADGAHYRPRIRLRPGLRAADPVLDRDAAHRLRSSNTILPRPSSGTRGLEECYNVDASR